MEGHILYLRQSEIDQNGDTCELDPLPLHLGYESYSEACAARVILERVYGKDMIEIDSVGTYYSLTE